MKTIIQCPHCEHIHVYDSKKYHSGQHVCSNCERWFMSDEIPEPMMAISVKQPWAWLICSGIKPIENRTWKMPEKYKGKRVLIHTGAKPVNMRNPSNIFTYEQWESLSSEQQVHVIGGKIPNSAIIGSVKFEDCFVNHPSVWAEHASFNWGYDKDGNVKKNTTYNWLLSHPILFEKPFLNVKGKLSFFHPVIE